MTQFFLTTHLTILQQEGYSVSRFFSWWLHHPLTHKISTKKPFVSTPKTKNLTRISIFFFVLIFSSALASHLYILATLLILSYLIFPGLYLSLAIFSYIPYEKYNRLKTIKKVRQEIISHKDLVTIGITGSFGKTSVKDFLYAILENYQETVKTPESYNTVFGIAKVVSLELLSKTKFFICEMGAYVRGEISELCDMVPPQYAILTAIGSQHLERFGSLKNTTLTKFELIDATAKNHCLVNLDNKYIADHLKDKKYPNVFTYSIQNPQADFFVSSYTITPKGLTFTITHQIKLLPPHISSFQAIQQSLPASGGRNLPPQTDVQTKPKTFHYTSPLFGTSNLYNLTAAVSMAKVLQVPEKIIQDSVSGITPSPHRLELKKINKATLIDNAFSSNEAGFTAVLNDLKNLPGKKVLITPGIIELGPQTAEVHRKLGQLSSQIFSKVILVGRSDRTQSFEQGLRSFLKPLVMPDQIRHPESHPHSKKRIPTITYIDNSANLWPLINELSQTYDWILLENDLPDTFQ